MPRFALVPSPFTGAAAWAPVAGLLPGAVAVDYGGVSGPDWYAGVAGRVAAAMGEEAWIGVLHSGAGGFAPALADVGAAGLIFVDAVRPHPGRSLRDVEPRFVDYLSARATDGLLQPWNRWFETDLLAEAVPDAAVRETLVADLPRTPAAFLDAVPPASEGWRDAPCAYLQLSARYAPQADWAESLGWPVRRLHLNHLAMVSHSQETAQALAALAEAFART